MSSDLTQVCTLKIVSLLMKAERKTVETFFAFLNNITGICKSPRENPFVKTPTHMSGNYY